VAIDSTYGWPGDGGASKMGLGAVSSTSNAGVAGSNYGSGGSGAHNIASAAAKDGGAGAAGIVIVTTFS
jgi:hypothetical protein